MLAYGLFGGGLDAGFASLVVGLRTKLLCSWFTPKKIRSNLVIPKYSAMKCRHCFLQVAHHPLA
jgi:hypothetical protein